MTEAPEPRFLCDEMLGKLARSLRLLGYDVAYAWGAENDTHVARMARDSGRLLLTRDIELSRRVPGSFLVTALDPEAQVTEVLTGLRLAPDPRFAFTRCSVCNTLLAPASAADVSGEVPEGILARHEKFWRCPGCRRVYWPGTHVARMEARWGLPVDGSGTPRADGERSS